MKITWFRRFVELKWISGLSDNGAEREIFEHKIVRLSDCEKVRREYLKSKMATEVVSSANQFVATFAGKRVS